MVAYSPIGSGQPSRRTWLDKKSAHALLLKEETACPQSQMAIEAIILVAVLSGCATFAKMRELNRDVERVFNTSHDAPHGACGSSKEACRKSWIEISLREGFPPLPCPGWQPRHN
jgi:hypothetical protein